MAEFRIDPAQLDASAKRVANHSTEVMSRIREVQKEVSDRRLIGRVLLVSVMTR
jgi:uncharacterized protein YukE